MASNYNTSSSYFTRDFIEQKPLRDSYMAPLRNDETTAENIRNSKIPHIKPSRLMDHQRSFSALDPYNTSKNRYISDQNR